MTPSSDVLTERPSQRQQRIVDAVPCTFCGAEPGEWCHHPGGQITRDEYGDWLHSVRRPRRGGTRKGAGRKAAADPRTVPIHARFTVDEARALDGARGTATRSEAVRELVLRGIGALK